MLWEKRDNIIERLNIVNFGSWSCRKDNTCVMCNESTLIFGKYYRKDRIVFLLLAGLDYFDGQIDDVWIYDRVLSKPKFGKCI